MGRMVTVFYPPTFGRFAGLAVLAVVVVGLQSCSAGGDLQPRPQLSAPADGSTPRFTDGDVRRLLLPISVLPASFRLVTEQVVPNEHVAQFFPDPAVTVQALNQLGRLTGATAEYHRTDAPRGRGEPIVVASSVAVYTDAAAAQAVLAAPDIVFAVHSVGLQADEIPLERVQHPYRGFRGRRAGDSADQIAYLALFRRENVVQSVLVVMMAADDDGGELVSRYVRRLALITPLPSEITSPR